MAKLSKKSAEWHYEKLLALHNFDYLTLAQKVSIFYHDLEHDILKEITGEKEYFEQFNWLKENQIRIERNIKTGEIRKVDISDIDNLKNWRNEGVHENKMPEPKYKHHFHTMAQTISFFSEIPWPVEINNIIDNQTTVKINSTNNIKKPKNNNKKLGKNESIKVINKKLSLKINNSNSAYSSINASVPQWSFNINNSYFYNDLYIILEDQDDKKLCCFYLKKGTIKNPENIFNQRNDNRIKNKSIIIIPKNDRNFTNNHREREYQFINYKILEMSYQ
jgi:hypothetical protein